MSISQFVSNGGSRHMRDILRYIYRASLSWVSMTITLFSCSYSSPESRNTCNVQASVRGNHRSTSESKATFHTALPPPNAPSFRTIARTAYATHFLMVLFSFCSMITLVLRPPLHFRISLIFKSLLIMRWLVLLNERGLFRGRQLFLKCHLFLTLIDHIARIPFGSMGLCIMRLRNWVWALFVESGPSAGVSFAVRCGEGSIFGAVYRRINISDAFRARNHSVAFNFLILRQLWLHDNPRSVLLSVREARCGADR
jgi:hypothetical protein